MVQRRTLLLRAASGALALLVVAGWVAGLLRWPAPGPQSLGDALAIADALGFYHGTDDARNVPTTRIVVSDFPVTRDRAGRLRVNVPHHPCWHGTVAVFRGPQQMYGNYDPHCSVFWGDLFVYGDPVLIERLTGIRPAAP